MMKRNARLDVPCGNKLESFFLQKWHAKECHQGLKGKTIAARFLCTLFSESHTTFDLLMRPNEKERRKTFSPVIV
jgi:hypothetical protein